MHPPREKFASRDRETAMAIERHEITSREQWLALRRQDVTASVVGALFGLHPYQTPAGLWAEKTGTEVRKPDTADLRRGRILEGAVANAVHEARPDWAIVKANEYLRDPEARLGATPDYWVVDPRRGLDLCGAMQCKTANKWEFDRSWGDDPPIWIMLQVLTEMMLSDSQWGVIACLIVDGHAFDLHLYQVTRHAGAEQRIRDAVAAFWADIAAGREPQIDYERDGSLISTMYRVVRKGAVIDLRGDNQISELLDRHLALKAFIESAKDELETVDNEIKCKLGAAEVALVPPGYKLSWKEQDQSGYVVAPRKQRVLRVTALEQR